jgi:hypothetical protein
MTIAKRRGTQWTFTRSPSGAKVPGLFDVMLTDAVTPPVPGTKMDKNFGAIFVPETADLPPFYATSRPTRRWLRVVAVSIGLSCWGGSLQTQAASPVTQPPLDLGQTSFLDGEAGPGPMIEVIGNGYTANMATGANGRALFGIHKQWSGSLTLHPVYISDIPVLGGHLGGELLFPFSVVHLNEPGVPETSQGGAGDITFAPFVQWSGLSVWGRPFSMRLAVQAVAPAGSYSAQRMINAGQSAWQVSPYLAFTWRANGQCEISGRLIYDWSSRTSYPPAILNAANAQAGDQFAIDLSASYAVSSSWRLGIASYALRQLSDTRVDGAAIADTRQQAFGVGPGLLWTNGHSTAVATLYREFATQNRPQGFNAILRFMYPF